MSFRRRRLVVVPIAFYEPNATDPIRPFAHVDRQKGCMDRMPMIHAINAIDHAFTTYLTLPVCGRPFRTRLRLSCG